MKKYTILILVVSLTWARVLFAQKPSTDSIHQKIELINSWLATLDTLSPFEDENALIDSLNNNVQDCLLQILHDKNIVKYKIDSLLHLQVTRSPDKKVIVFSFYENSGGSYKSNINIIYYQLPNGQPKAERLTFCKDNVGHSEEYYGGNIEKIVILKSKNGIKYLALGGGISCNTCEFNYTVLLDITNTSLQTDFCLLLEYRMYDGKVVYHPKERSISYEYTVNVDDSIYGTDCSGGQKINDTQCTYRGKYTFNGRTFVKQTKK